MYTKLAEIPVPTGAQFLGSSQAIQLSFSVRDHERNVKKTLLKNVILPPSSEAIRLPAQEVDYVAARYSPSGRKRVVLREVKNDSGTKRFVEIWEGEALKFNVDVSDKHGAFYPDEFLGSLSFSHEETSIVYTAERVVEKSDEDPYAKFRFKPDLGEGLSGKRRPTAFIINWDQSHARVSRIATPDNLYLGQCIFSPSSALTLFATAYELQPDWRLLGIKFCFNRPSGIWRITLSPAENPSEWQCELKKLTAPEISCRSPRTVGNDLLWLSEASGGAHAKTSMLYFAPNSDSDNLTDSSALIDVVEQPRSDGFPGLYPAANLPSSLLLSINSDSPTHIALHTHYGSRTVVILVSFKGEITVLDPGDTYSWAVLATDGKSRIVCSRSTPAVPYEVVVADIRDVKNVSWKVVDQPTIDEDVATALASIQTQIIKIPDREPTETILIQSSSTSGVPPCVLMPHGGPHAAITTAFNPANTALVLEGYTLSLLNYTGSLGFGEAPIQALLGNCGRVDVDDCMASVEHLIKLGIAEDGPGNLFVMGGSHGGFLTAHLIGQFPDKFTAASMRNPVISGGDTTTTDIPDWYYSEFGCPYPIQSSSQGSSTSTTVTSKSHLPPLMDSETFKKLQAASPIAYVDAVKTPTQLFIGLSDRRVSPSHGIEYYHALKARFQDKSQVDLLVFEGESHPLDGVETAKVCFEATRDWFAKAKAAVQ
ncbi:hypothetical protein EST38_g3573 [Candolleomyces aberdarensis]|uniref:acylaminoacyl-peptidase n=1 Tax=Candolleomyces aberdarensis TaxID=2316362 RepID=A0A4Q2DQD9_9AGAR|nr:hypothetical protein EST38_g3573 [Candolleomyces aberdarensis]